MTHNNFRFAILLFLLCLLIPLASSADNIPPSFLNQKPKEVNSFVEDVVKKHKLDRAQLIQWFGATKVQDRVIELIKKPYESKPWHEYREIFVNENRAKQGVEFWQKHEKLIADVADKYGIPPEIFIAIVGVETNYGSNTGKFKVFEAIASIAFDYPKRADYFKRELEQLLLLMQEQKFSPMTLLGSYAGAMGMPQFMPSSYRSYAVDFNGDGKKDLLGSIDDVLGSVANYFKSHSWQNGKSITLPISGDVKILAQLAVDKATAPDLTVAALRKKGITISKNISDTEKAVVLGFDLGENKKEYWLGLNNFYVITRYNNSNRYAMAVFQLAERIKSLKTIPIVASGY